MMTKLLSSMGDMETRFTSMESRITSMESRLQPPPTLNPTASMPYGMPEYGSTTLASSSSTAAATLSTAPPTSSPTLPITKDLCADIRVTIVQIQAALQEMIQLERKREAVVHLQAATRKFLARRLVRVMRKEQQDQAASFIQAAVRLQAAARRLLARRRLQEMRRKMHEAALMAVDRGKGECNLAPSDGHQRSRQLAAVFKRAQGSELQFYSSDKRGTFLLVIGGGTLPSAITFRHRPPRGRLRWSLLRLVSSGHTYPSLSFRWSPWDPGGDIRADPARGGCPPYLQESSKIKSHSLFKISRDVKGLFFGVQFASSGVIVSVIVRLQFEDKLYVQVGCSVRGVKGLLGLSPLGFISRLLRGQVNLSI